MPFGHYWLEKLGFSNTECGLLAWTFNGILENPEFLEYNSWVSYLRDSVDDTRANFAQFQQDFGFDPADPTAPADRELQYHDLIEKIDTLTEVQARDVRMYIIGWWDGRSHPDAKFQNT